MRWWQNNCSENKKKKSFAGFVKKKCHKTFKTLSDSSFATVSATCRLVAQQATAAAFGLAVADATRLSMREGTWQTKFGTGNERLRISNRADCCPRK